MAVANYGVIAAAIGAQTYLVAAVALDRPDRRSRQADDNAGMIRRAAIVCVLEEYLIAELGIPCSTRKARFSGRPPIPIIGTTPAAFVVGVNTPYAISAMPVGNPPPPPLLPPLPLPSMLKIFAAICANVASSA